MDGTFTLKTSGLNQAIQAREKIDKLQFDNKFKSFGKHLAREQKLVESNKNKLNALDIKEDNLKEQKRLRALTAQMKRDSTVQDAHIYAYQKMLAKKLRNKRISADKRDIFLSKYRENHEQINILSHRLQKCIDNAKYKKIRKLL